MLQDVLARIEERLVAVGLSAAAASKQAGLSEDAIRNLKRAVKTPDGRQGVSTRTIAALAPVLQTTQAWLLDGIGTPEPDHPSTLIPVEGLVGAGGEIEPDYQGHEGDNVRQIEVQLNLQPGLVAYEVWGDSMLPKYDPGDFVIVRQEPSPAERVMGDVALVVTRDGRRFIKRVQPGSREGLYNLESFNARTMTDVEVETFGMIYLVLPAKQAHKPVAEKEVHRRSRGKKKPEAAE